MIVRDADNGGKLGPTSFIGAAFLLAFYTGDGGIFVEPPTTGDPDIGVYAIDPGRGIFAQDLGRGVYAIDPGRGIVVFPLN